ncbi:hypothetical protein ABIB25_004199 [Nakamurella sp. UYEF19]
MTDGLVLPLTIPVFGLVGLTIAVGSRDSIHPRTP